MNNQLDLTLNVVGNSLSVKALDLLGTVRYSHYLVAFGTSANSHGGQYSVTTINVSTPYPMMDFYCIVYVIGTLVSCTKTLPGL